MDAVSAAGALYLHQQQEQPQQMQQVLVPVPFTSILPNGVQIQQWVLVPALPHAAPSAAVAAAADDAPGTPPYNSAPLLPPSSAAATAMVSEDVSSHIVQGFSRAASLGTTGADDAGYEAAASWRAAAHEPVLGRGRKVVLGRAVRTNGKHHLKLLQQAADAAVDAARVEEEAATVDVGPPASLAAAGGGSYHGSAVSDTDEPRPAGAATAHLRQVHSAPLPSAPAAAVGADELEAELHEVVAGNSTGLIAAATAAQLQLGVPVHGSNSQYCTPVKPPRLSAQHPAIRGSLQHLLGSNCPAAPVSESTPAAHAAAFPAAAPVGFLSPSSPPSFSPGVTRVPKAARSHPGVRWKSKRQREFGKLLAAAGSAGLIGGFVEELQGHGGTEAAAAAAMGLGESSTNVGADAAGAAMDAAGGLVGDDVMNSHPAAAGREAAVRVGATAVATAAGTSSGSQGLVSSSTELATDGQGLQLYSWPSVVAAAAGAGAGAGAGAAQGHGMQGLGDHPEAAHDALLTLHSTWAQSPETTKPLLHAEDLLAGAFPGFSPVHQHQYHHHHHHQKQQHEGSGVAGRRSSSNSYSPIQLRLGASGALLEHLFPATLLAAPSFPPEGSSRQEQHLIMPQQQQLGQQPQQHHQQLGVESAVAAGEAAAIETDDGGDDGVLWEQLSEGYLLHLQHLPHLEHASCTTKAAAPGGGAAAAGGGGDGGNVVESGTTEASNAMPDTFNSADAAGEVDLPAAAAAAAAPLPTTSSALASAPALAAEATDTATAAAAAAAAVPQLSASLGPGSAAGPATGAVARTPAIPSGGFSSMPPPAPVLRERADLALSTAEPPQQQPTHDVQTTGATAAAAAAAASPAAMAVATSAAGNNDLPATPVKALVGVEAEHVHPFSPGMLFLGGSVPRSSSAATAAAAASEASMALEEVADDAGAAAAVAEEGGRLAAADAGAEGEGDLEVTAAAQEAQAAVMGQRQETGIATETAERGPLPPAAASEAGTAAASGAGTVAASQEAGFSPGAGSGALDVAPSVRPLGMTMIPSSPYLSSKKRLRLMAARAGGQQQVMLQQQMLELCFSHQQQQQGQQQEGEDDKQQQQQQRQQQQGTKGWGSTAGGATTQANGASALVEKGGAVASTVLLSPASAMRSRAVRRQLPFLSGVGSAAMPLLPISTAAAAAAGDAAATGAPGSSGGGGPPARASAPGLMGSGVRRTARRSLSPGLSVIGPGFIQQRFDRDQGRKGSPFVLDLSRRAAGPAAAEGVVGGKARDEGAGKEGGMVGTARWRQQQQQGEMQQEAWLLQREQMLAYNSVFREQMEGQQGQQRDRAQGEAAQAQCGFAFTQEEQYKPAAAEVLDTGAAAGGGGVAGLAVGGEQFGHFQDQLEESEDSEDGDNLAGASPRTPGIRKAAKHSAAPGGFPGGQILELGSPPMLVPAGLPLSPPWVSGGHGFTSPGLVPGLLPGFCNLGVEGAVNTPWGFMGLGGMLGFSSSVKPQEGLVVQVTPVPAKKNQGKRMEISKARAQKGQAGFNKMLQDTSADAQQRVGGGGFANSRVQRRTRAAVATAGTATQQQRQDEEEEEEEERNERFLSHSEGEEKAHAEEQASRAAFRSRQPQGVAALLGVNTAQPKAAATAAGGGAANQRLHSTRKQPRPSMTNPHAAAARAAACFPDPDNDQQQQDKITLHVRRPPQQLPAGPRKMRLRLRGSEAGTEWTGESSYQRGQQQQKEEQQQQQQQGEEQQRQQQQQVEEKVQQSHSPEDKEGAVGVDYKQQKQQQVSSAKGDSGKQAVAISQSKAAASAPNGSLTGSRKQKRQQQQQPVCSLFAGGIEPISKRTRSSCATPADSAVSPPPAAAPAAATVIAAASDAPAEVSDVGKKVGSKSSTEEGEHESHVQHVEISTAAAATAKTASAVTVEDGVQTPDDASVSAGVQQQQEQRKQLQEQQHEVADVRRKQQQQEGLAPQEQHEEQQATVAAEEVGALPLPPSLPSAAEDAPIAEHPTASHSPRTGTTAVRCTAPATAAAAVQQSPASPSAQVSLQPLSPATAAAAAARDLPVSSPGGSTAAARTRSLLAAVGADPDTAAAAAAAAAAVADAAEALTAAAASDVDPGLSPAASNPSLRTAAGTSKEVRVSPASPGSTARRRGDLGNASPAGLELRRRSREVGQAAGREAEELALAAAAGAAAALAGSTAATSGWLGSPTKSSTLLASSSTLASSMVNEDAEERLANITAAAAAAAVAAAAEAQVAAVAAVSGDKSATPISPYRTPVKSTPARTPVSRPTSSSIVATCAMSPKSPPMGFRGKLSPGKYTLTPVREFVQPSPRTLGNRAGLMLSPPSSAAKPHHESPIAEPATAAVGGTGGGEGDFTALARTAEAAVAANARRQGHGVSTKIRAAAAAAAAAGGGDDGGDGAGVGQGSSTTITAAAKLAVAVAFPSPKKASGGAAGLIRGAAAGGSGGAGGGAGSGGGDRRARGGTGLQGGGASSAKRGRARAAGTKQANAGGNGDAALHILWQQQQVAMAVAAVSAAKNETAAVDDDIEAAENLLQLHSCLWDRSAAVDASPPPPPPAAAGGAAGTADDAVGGSVKGEVGNAQLEKVGVKGINIAGGKGEGCRKGEKQGPTSVLQQEQLQQEGEAAVSKDQGLQAQHDRKKRDGMDVQRQQQQQRLKQGGGLYNGVPVSPQASRRRRSAVVGEAEAPTLGKGGSSRGSMDKGSMKDVSLGKAITAVKGVECGMGGVLGNEQGDKQTEHLQQQQQMLAEQLVQGAAQQAKLQQVVGVELYTLPEEPAVKQQLQQPHESIPVAVTVQKPHQQREGSRAVQHSHDLQRHRSATAETNAAAGSPAAKRSAARVVDSAAAPAACGGETQPPSPSAAAAGGLAAPATRGTVPCIAAVAEDVAGAAGPRMRNKLARELLKAAGGDAKVAGALRGWGASIAGAGHEAVVAKEAVPAAKGLQQQQQQEDGAAVEGRGGHDLGAMLDRGAREQRKGQGGGVTAAGRGGVLGSAAAAIAAAKAAAAARKASGGKVASKAADTAAGKTIAVEPHNVVAATAADGAGPMAYVQAAAAANHEVAAAARGEAAAVADVTTSTAAETAAEVQASPAAEVKAPPAAAAAPIDKAAEGRGKSAAARELALLTGTAAAVLPKVWNDWAVRPKRGCAAAGDGSAGLMPKGRIPTAQTPATAAAAGLEGSQHLLATAGTGAGAPEPQAPMKARPAGVKQEEDTSGVKDGAKGQAADQSPGQGVARKGAGVCGVGASPLGKSKGTKATAAGGGGDDGLRGDRVIDLKAGREASGAPKKAKAKVAMGIPAEVKQFVVQQQKQQQFQQGAKVNSSCGKKGQPSREEQEGKRKKRKQEQLEGGEDVQQKKLKGSSGMLQKTLKSGGEGQVLLLAKGGSRADGVQLEKKKGAVAEVVKKRHAAQQQQQADVEQKGKQLLKPKAEPMEVEVCKGTQQQQKKKPHRQQQQEPKCDIRGVKHQHKSSVKQSNESDYGCKPDSEAATKKGAKSQCGSEPDSSDNSDDDSEDEDWGGTRGRKRQRGAAAAGAGAGVAAAAVVKQEQGAQAAAGVGNRGGVKINKGGRPLGSGNKQQMRPVGKGGFSARSRTFTGVYRSRPPHGKWRAQFSWGGKVRMRLGQGRGFRSISRHALWVNNNGVGGKSRGSRVPSTHAWLKGGLDSLLIGWRAPFYVHML